jgi:hypothetical protein
MGRSGSARNGTDGCSALQGRISCFSTPAFKGLDLSQAPDTLTSSCGHDPAIACRFVWDGSHSGTAARLTAVYLAGPANLVLRLAWLVLLALVARALVHRLINRVTSRAADAPRHSRLRQSGDAAAGRKRWRRGRSRLTTDSVLAGTNTAAGGEQAQPGPPAGQALRRTATALDPGTAPSRTRAHKTPVRPRVTDVPLNGRETSAPPGSPGQDLPAGTGESDLGRS